MTIAQSGATPELNFTGTGTLTVTLTMPPGAKPGDLLVANIVNYASGHDGAVFNSGTAWTTIRTTRLSGQDNTRLGVYDRVVTEADSGTFQIGSGDDAPFAAAGVVMAGLFSLDECGLRGEPIHCHRLVRIQRFSTIR